MENREIVCVILAGGQGKRMRSIDRHKVCFPVAGAPAIVRTVGMFKSLGMKRFLVVVGQMAEQVIATLAGAHPDVAFVYQASPRGTGHAVRCAADVLAAADYRGDVLVTMGDKVLQPHVVTDLIARHAERGADMTLAALPKDAATTAGRIVVVGGHDTGRRTTGGRSELTAPLSPAGHRDPYRVPRRPLGIVELADIKAAAAHRRRLRVGSRSMTAAQVERASSSVNASLYLFRAEALYEALARLADDNAQGELYLTDTVAIANAAGRTVAVLDVPNPEDIMAYNTPEELLAIEEVLRRRAGRRQRIALGGAALSARQFRTAGKWLEVLASDSPRLRSVLASIYGADESVLAERRRAFADVLRAFVARHGGDRKLVLARAPGRVNLMGRHVDHRGGFVNVMAINRDVILAAAPRADDVVSLANLDPAGFPDRSFRIGELLRAAEWTDWMDFISSSTVRQVLEAYRGDWSNYAKAAVLRLQHACADHRLSGMDCVVAGNIPMGAGLSSSSAVVVAVAEAAVALNGLNVTTRQFVDLCGEGEWFVGSRGGSADHAAIRTGERGRVARVGFFPFRIERMIPLPEELSLVIANSHVHAAKSAGARDTFNQRVACYRLSEMLLRKRVAFLKGMEHLRDVNGAALGVSPAEIYRALKHLPLSVTRGAAERLLNGEAALGEIFASHRNVGPYRLRDVTMYGISECIRSDMFAGLLEQGLLEDVGLLMRISHDGDRVVRWRGGKPVPHRPSYSDARLDQLIRETGGGEAPAAAALWAQPGRYACSTPEIDLIVDAALGTPGVIGAQVAGAGLGGCAMVLTRSESLDDLLGALRRSYYEPKGLAFDVHVCRPVAGSGILNV